MAVYNVYLVDILNVIGTDDRRNEVMSFLTDYFTKVTAKAKIADGCNVQWVTQNPQARDVELICYYSAGPVHVVSQMQSEGSTMPIGDTGGLTKWMGSTIGSDVFANGQSSTKLIANLTFHELMHNKQQLGDSMHDQRGLASENVDATTALTTGNIEAMAASLPKKHPQWTGGFGALMLKKQGDPISPL